MTYQGQSTQGWICTTVPETDVITSLAIARYFQGRNVPFVVVRHDASVSCSSCTYNHFHVLFLPSTHCKPSECPFLQWCRRRTPRGHRGPHAAVIRDLRAYWIYLTKIGYTIMTKTDADLVSWLNELAHGPHESEEGEDPADEPGVSKNKSALKLSTIMDLVKDSNTWNRTAFLAWCNKLKGQRLRFFLDVVYSSSSFNADYAKAVEFLRIGLDQCQVEGSSMENRPPRRTMDGRTREHRSNRGMVETPTNRPR